MNQTVEFLVRSILIGAGATMVMDLWTLTLRLFGIKSLNYAHLGRWIGHLRNGQWIHQSIAGSPPVRGELLIGWCAHYLIGITFASLTTGVFGLQWARSPSLSPALLIGIATVMAPYFVLQPGLGAGVASAKTPNPGFNRIKSLATHTVFGFGLYLAALATIALLPAGSP